MRNLKFAYHQIIAARPDLFDWVEAKGHAGVWLLDLQEANNFWMNPKGLQLLGYEHITLAIWEQHIAKADWPHLKEMFHAPYFESSSKNIKLQKADGHSLQLDCAMQLVMNGNGAPDVLLGAMTCFKYDDSCNLAMHKAIEDALRAAHEKLSKLAALVPGVVYQFQLFEDGRTCFPYASPGIQQIYAVSPEEVSQDATIVFERLHPDDRERVTADIYKSAADLSIFHCEYRVILPGKSPEWRLSNARPERMSDGSTLWYGIITDITDSVNHLQRIESLLQVEEEQNKRLRNFTHIVSHNLRSHTANMMGIFSLVELEAQALLEHELIHMVKIAAENLNETLAHLNQVLDINLRAKEKYSRIDLTATVRAAMSSVALLAKNAGVKLTFDTRESVFLEAVPAYMDSIVLNMLTNAIKFRSEDRPSYVKIRLEKVAAEIRLSFEDNGLGIDLARHGAKLFGMYKTFHGHKDSKGLGLFITKNHIEAMGGSISVESVVNKGTSFIIKFPI